MDRALIHIEQGRYDRAIPELKLHLSEEPQDAYAHAMLSLCYSNIDQYEDALKYSNESIGLMPDLDFAFYTKARAHLGLSNYKAAKAAIDEAINLEPFDADYYGLKALIYSDSSDWKKVLEFSNKGLGVNPEHLQCINSKAMALRKLNLRDEEAETLKTALQDDPEDEFTHANLGWSYLEKGDRNKALEHFHQALRINPEYGWAREGVLTAMKSKNIIYRTVLKYFFWIGKKKESHQQGLMFGLFVGYLLVLNLSYQYPILNYLVYPYIVIALSTWLSEPFFTAVLYSSKDGRIILTEREKKESLVFVPLALTSLVTLVLYIVYDTHIILLSLFLFLGLLIGISAVSRYHSIEARRIGVLFMICFFLLSGSSIVAHSLNGLWKDFFFNSALYMLIGFQLFLQGE